MSFREHMKGYEDLRTLAQTDRLYAWNHELYFPPALVEINPTNRCNQQCRYCYTNKRIESHEMLGDAILIDSFAQVAEAGVGAVVVQGTGEPLMHKALARAIENGAKHQLAIGLCTNGILLNKNLQDGILPHLLYIRFSVVDRFAPRYAHLHGCLQSQWDILVDNISNIVKRRESQGLKLGLCATVYLYKENFHDAVNIVRFFKDLGIDYIFIQEATYTGFSPAGKESAASNDFSGAEIQEMKESILALSDDDCRVKVKFPLYEHTSCESSQWSNWIKDNCQGMKFYAIISCDGGVYPCWRAWGKKEHCYGNLYEQRFEEIWKGEVRQRIEAAFLRTPPSGDECLNCNNAKINGLLSEYRNANSQWKDFVL